MSAAASLVRLSGACLGGTLFWQGFVHYLREAHKDGVKQRTVTDMGGNKIKDTFLKRFLIYKMEKHVLKFFQKLKVKKHVFQVYKIKNTFLN